MTLNRRTFLGSASLVAASLASPMVRAAAHGKPKVVVIGGGAGGATAARTAAPRSVQGRPAPRQIGNSQA